MSNLHFTICFKVRTCVSCQKFEKLKTEAPELKPIKPVSPWFMIGEFYTYVPISFLSLDLFPTMFSFF